MISTDFAPNESWDDAWLSLKLLIQPWRWKYGLETEKVKEKIKKLLNVTSYKLHVTCFLSGRSALYYLLKSLNLPKNSKVIVQAFTCEAVVLPIIANKLKPVYIDIENETYSMDLNSLTRKLVNSKTDSVKVLILQHTFGLTPKFRKEIITLAQKNKLIVIEDLAHGFSPSIFRTDNRLPITDHYFLLSFGRSKMLSSVFGGAIIAPNNIAIEQYNNLAMPSYFFIFRCLLYKPLTMLIKSTYDFYLGKILHKILDEFGLLIPEITEKEKKGGYDELFNKAYPNALAILLLHQLSKFDQIKKRRLQICSLYNQHLKDVTSYMLNVTNQPLIRYPSITEKRNRVLEKAKKYNIYLGKWYDHPISPKDLNLDRVEYSIKSCPKAEEICKKIINLPTNITVDDAQMVIKILNDVN